MDDHTNTKEQNWHVHVIHIDQYHRNLLKTLTFLLIKNSSNKHPSSLNLHPLKRKTKNCNYGNHKKPHRNMYTTLPLV